MRTRKSSLLLLAGLLIGTAACQSEPTEPAKQSLRVRHIAICSHGHAKWRGHAGSYAQAEHEAGLHDADFHRGQKTATIMTQR